MPKKKKFDPSLIKESFYKVERLPNGFKICREGYFDAEVIISERFFLQVTLNKKDKKEVRSCCFMEFHQLKKIFTDEMLSIWEQNNAEKIANNKFKKLPKKIKAWMEIKFQRGLTFVLYPEWKEITSKFEPEVYGVFKKFMVVRGPKNRFPGIFYHNKLWENKGLINDLLRYNAIHFCIDRAEVVEAPDPFDKDHKNHGKIIFSNSGISEYRRELYRTENWRMLFSNCEHTYKALNKTLNEMPRGIFTELVYNLKKIHLPEPITDRIKFVAVACALNMHNNPHHVDCVLRSSPEQIRKAFKLFKKNYEKVHKFKAPYTLRGCKGISHLINYVFDFDGTHDGEIVGLLEKSHRWHQEEETRQEARRQQWAIEEAERRREFAVDAETRKKQEEEDRKKPTKSPPIELPNREEIRFLDTVESVFQEGTDMGHCISSYAKKAMEGECYLFHVEIHGQKASVMIDKEGKLIQSYGPRNCVNKASEWGGNVLQSWGNTLSKYLMAGMEASLKEAMSEDRALV